MRTFFTTAAIIAASCLILGAPASAGASVSAQAQNHLWREIATERDRERIRDWRSTWVEAVREARPNHEADILRERALLDPDAALPGPNLPPGDYLCRTIKIGGQSEALPDWVAYPAFRCRVVAEDETLSFVRLDGSQRPVGRFYPDSPRRMIFLGTLQLGDERRVRRYGSDPDRDLAGLLERVGEQRWRLVFPAPAFESMLDVIELVPAS